VAEPFWEEGHVVLHGQTYAGHASVCAAGLANIAIIEREGLLARARELEGDLFNALAPLRDHPLVGDVRGGTGLMALVELAPEVLEADPGAGMTFYRAIRASGVITRAHAVGVAISPPLIITREQIRELADGVHAGLERLAAVGATA
jgi:adenosylmethionine-8-amino-7-oxononanoate aminotransferase